MESTVVEEGWRAVILNRDTLMRDSLVRLRGAHGVRLRVILCKSLAYSIVSYFIDSQVRFNMNEVLNPTSPQSKEECDRQTLGDKDTLRTEGHLGPAPHTPPTIVNWKLLSAQSWAISKV